MTFQPEPGTILQDRYLLQEELGRGGMGIVFLADDTHLKRQVAVKVLFSQSSDADGRLRLLEEARATAKLNHPNIVVIYDAIDYGGTPFIVMEHIQGRSLREKEEFSIEDIVAIARDIVAALEHAHQHGIVHRDLKPENVLITQSGQTMLMDFGLARDLRNSRLSDAGTLTGTIAFLAPELILGQPASPQSDFYALGVLLYEAVAGRYPFEAENPAVLLTNHLHAPVIPPSVYNPQITPALDDLILQLLEKEPAIRISSTSEILIQLEQILETEDDTPALDREIPITALLSRIARGRMVSREKELADATALWLRALSGRASMVLISGEPGIGKTRLAQAVIAQCRVGGAEILRGGCYEFESTTPYLPLIEAIQDWAMEQDTESLRETLGSTASELARLIPEIENRLGPFPASASLSPEEQRRLLFENIAQFLNQMAQDSGLLLFFDDLHWADHGTITAVSYLMRRLENAKILFVGAYREVELDRAHPLAEALVQWNRQRIVTRIQLARFTLAETNGMIATLFGQDRVSNEFAQVVHQETEGNPFFIEEVMKSLVESGQIYWSSDHWERDELEELAIPQSIKEAIGRRLNRLSKSCIDVLHLAAVIGKDFPYNLLINVLNEDEELILDALEEATESQLIVPAGTDVFIFTHDKIREVLYDEILSVRRSRIHHQIAGAIEDSGEPINVEDLAYHYIAAGKIEKGLTFALKAAQKAQKIFASDEALGYYQQALECTLTLDDELARALIYEEMGDIYSTKGPFKTAIENYESAIGLTSSAKKKAALKVRMGLVYTVTNDEQAIPYFEEALDMLDPGEQPSDVARALTGLGRFKHYRCQYSGAIDLFERARKLAEPLEDTLTLFFIHAYMAGAYQHLARFEESMAWAQEGIQIGKELNDPHMVAIGYELVSEDWSIMGYWDRAIKDAEKNHEMGKSIGSSDRMSWATWNMGHSLVGKGELAKGRELLEAALELASFIGEKRLMILCHSSLAMANVDAGSDDMAIDHINQAVQDSHKMVELYQQGYSTQMKGYVHLQLGNWQLAADTFRASHDIIEDTEVLDIIINSLPYYAESELHLGHLDAAGTLLESSLKLSEETGARHYEAVSHRVLGQLLASRGEFSGAADAYENAIGMAEETASHLELGRIHYYRALLRNLSGEVELGQRDATLAQQIFSECQAARDLKKANALLSG